MVFIFVNCFQKMKRRFHDTYKLYEIEIAASINKVLLNIARFHLRMSVATFTKQRTE